LRTTKNIDRKVISVKLLKMLM